MSDEQVPHRLFAAIVLMGTGLALGCGGISQADRSADQNGGEPGNGGSGGGGGSGRPTTSTGGSPAGPGGGGALAVGGATSTNGGASPPDIDPTPVMPGPFACPPEKWSCSGEGACSGNGWALQENCECDETRPTQGSDCAEGLVFVCKRATSTSDGRLLAEPVSMSCACVAPSVSFCNDECDRAYDTFSLECAGDPMTLTALCGCALILLK